MDKILAQFWAMCILKAGPQDLPASRFLATATSLVYTFLSVVFYLDRLKFATALAAGMVDFALMAVLSYLILWVRLLGSRWLQTLTALAGTGIILTIIALAIEYSLAFLPNVQVAADLVSIFGIVQLAWSAVIISHILRHALSVRPLLAAVFTAVYIYIALNVIRTLFFFVSE